MVTVNHIQARVIGGLIAIAWGLAVMLLSLAPSRKEAAMTRKIVTRWRTILMAGIVIGVAGIIGEMV